ncbi:MAG TPA: (2Fe-2S)-binding protein [Mycobacterium sp.]|nr:(2Fe-2S)-binding protein [Mycobacterium sp.]
MYVCLCAGVTNQTVANAVDAGARTSREVADACGAGGECGRCRRTVRAIIDSRRTAEGPRQVPGAQERR